jgi:RsiW-degrading membrane proteinase PrsW (M82 family)
MASANLPAPPASESEHRHGVVVPGALRRRLWLYVFVAGALTWLAAAVITEATGDTILVPNVIFVGSFLIPVCTVLYVLGHPREAHLSVEVLLMGFLVGGTVGLLLSGGIEVWLLPDAVGTNVVIGLVEEGTKALAVLAVGRFVLVRVPRDGMVLGLTVGAGFAAFESAGYALRALIESRDQSSVISILETEMNRAVLAPFGHLTWTALVGGALFATAWPAGRFTVNRRLVATFAGVMALHALWDLSDGLAIRLTEGLGGEGWTLGWPNKAAWVGSPTGAVLIRFNVLSAAGGATRSTGGRARIHGSPQQALGTADDEEDADGGERHREELALVAPGDLRRAVDPRTELLGAPPGEDRRGDGEAEPDRVVDHDLDDGVAEAGLGVGDPGQREEVEQAGDVGEDAGRRGQAQRGVASEPGQARVAPVRLAARARDVAPGPHGGGEAQRGEARRHVREVAEVRVVVAGLDAVEERDDEDADDGAHAEAGRDEREQQPTRLVAGQQRVERRHAGARTDRADRGEEDRLEAQTELGFVG